MALSTYALVSLDELKEKIGAGGTAKDGALEAIVNRVSDAIEQYLDRQIVTRTTADPLTRLTEYHSFQEPEAELRTLERPIISIATIHEDVGLPRSYATSSLLVDGTDYEVVKPRGRVRRINGAGLLREWALGHRVVRVVYSAGYADTAAVPQRIKDEALKYAALIWREQKDGAFGVSGASDTLGNYTRFAAASLNKDMQTALWNERRWTSSETGERDA